MAGNRWTRKQLRRPDEFVSTSLRAWDVVQKHVMPISLGVLAALLIFFGATAWGWWSDRRGAEATAALERAIKTSAGPLLGEAEEAPPGEAAPNAPSRFKTAKERAEAVLRQLDAASVRRGRVRLQAQLLRAGAALDLGRVDEAVRLYREYLDASDDRASMRALAHEGLGYALERKGDTAGALAEFKRMAPPPDGDAYQPHRDRALWHEGRLLEKLGRRDEARKIYQLLVEKFAASPLRDEVEGRLATLGD